MTRPAPARHYSPVGVRDIPSTQSHERTAHAVGRVKQPAAVAGRRRAAAPRLREPTHVGEPPSVKLIVRLFVIPLIIVALAVGVMFLIALMAGGTPSIEEALDAPASARAATAPPTARRAGVQAALHGRQDARRPDEGRHERGRADQAGRRAGRHAREPHARRGRGDPPLPAAGAGPGVAARPVAAADELGGGRRVARKALGVAAGLRERQGRRDAQGGDRSRTVVPRRVPARCGEAIPLLVAKLADASEDLDVRLAAATVLGPLASAGRRGRDRGAAVRDAQRATRTTSSWSGARACRWRSSTRPTSPTRS